MNKRIMSVFFCLTILLSLAACSNTEENITDTNVNIEDATISPIEDVEITSQETRISVIAAGDNIPHDSVINTA